MTVAVKGAGSLVLGIGSIVISHHASMSSKAPRPQRLQGYLQENIQIFRQRIIGVPHRYWNKAMSPLAQWTVYVTHIFPPDTGSLRARIVVEARQTARDGDACGAVIGPFVYITPLLVELEKRSKAQRPPSYWDKRPPTTRKAEEQLRVEEQQAVWFLSKYLQGEIKLTDDVLPPAELADPEFRSSFSEEQVLQALRSKRQRNKRSVRAAYSKTAPPSVGLAKRTVQMCDVCASPLVVAQHDLVEKTGVIGQSTGFACQPCGSAMCATCLYIEASKFVQRRDLALESTATFTHAGRQCPRRAKISVPVLANILVCADPAQAAADEAAQKFLTGDEPRLNVDKLVRSLAQTCEYRQLFHIWKDCFDSTSLMRCPASTCGGAWLESLEVLRAGPAVPCPFCRREICVRCGEETRDCRSPCHCRRPALRGAAAGSREAPFAQRFIVESVVHTVHATLRRLCTTQGCGATRFVEFHGADARCEQCGADGCGHQEEIDKIISAIVKRTAIDDVVLSPSEISVAGQQPKQWAKRLIVQQVRTLLQTSSLVTRFASKDLFCDRLEAALLRDQ